MLINKRVVLQVFLSFFIFLNSEEAALSNIITNTDLGTLGGTSSVAFGVSADGSVVVGHTFNSLGSDRAFKYDGSTMINLGTLGGDYSYGRGVSSDGSTAVGVSTTSGGDFHAFKYVGSTMSDLGTLGGNYSDAYGASSDGSIIVGESTTSGGDTHAFKYSGTTMTDLGTLGGTSSRAYAVSSDGSVIVGYANTAGGAAHAFKYSGSTMSDLGVLSGLTSSVATSVSSDGSVIVGYSYTGFGAGNRAFKYEGSTMTDIGTLGGSTSKAHAISADGTTIVGESVNGDGNTHAFKYVGSTMTDIGTLGGTYSMAYGVSSDGLVIVGKSATSGDATTHAFVYKDQLVDVNNTSTALYYNGAQFNSLLNLKNSLIANNLKQDCNNFGSKNLCVGVSARYANANTHNAEKEAGILKVAYKFNDYFRAGFLLDQTLANNNPSNFKSSDQIPMTMLFANLSQNKDGSGLNLRLAGSYSKESLNITRTALLSYTEAGSGSANLTSSGFLGELSYGKKLSDKLNVLPSLGIRHSQIVRSSYTETSNATFPIYYQTLKQSLTVATAGLNLKFNSSKKLQLIAGGGFEHNLHSKTDGYAGYINYMGSFSLNGPSTVQNRAFVNAAASYSISENQKIIPSVYYGKQQFNNANISMFYLGYVMGW